MKNTIELSEEEVKAALTLYCNHAGVIVNTNTFEYIETDEGMVVLVEEVEDVRLIPIAPHDTYPIYLYNPFWNIDPILL